MYRYQTIQQPSKVASMLYPTIRLAIDLLSYLTHQISFKNRTYISLYQLRQRHLVHLPIVPWFILRQQLLKNSHVRKQRKLFIKKWDEGRPDKLDIPVVFIVHQWNEHWGQAIWRNRRGKLPKPAVPYLPGSSVCLSIVSFQNELRGIRCIGGRLATSDGRNKW